MEIPRKQDSVLFASFSPYVNGNRDPKNGNIDPFISFFVPRVRKFVLIDQPDPGSSIIPPIIEVYSGGKLFKKYKLKSFIYKPFYWFLKKINVVDNRTNVFYKIRDFLSVIHVGVTSGERFNYFIGLESINALAGLVLRKLGFVDKVIYYVSDYSPQRYDSKLFNGIYLWLDRLCCYNADFIWDVSRAMQKARIKAGLNEKKSAPVVHVPNALFPKYIQHLDLNQLAPFSLVFMGSLGYENGPDLAIASLPLVIKKIKETRLHIIGGGKNDLPRLKDLVRRLNLGKYVKFYGLIPKDEDMYSTLRKFYLGLAPYLKLKGSVRLYGDSLKLRAYMASGIPVITTEVPPLGRELLEFGSAIITKDEKKDLSWAIIKILSDNTLYGKYRQKAIEYGKNNTWDNTFNGAFNQMNKKRAL